MTFQRPTVLPKWADSDQVEPISGQNNVNTPPDELQNVGWLYKEFPPRQWFNWLGRYTYRWLAYLSQQESQAKVKEANAGNGYTVGVFDFTSLPPQGAMITLNVVDEGAGGGANFYSGIGYAPNPIAPVTLNPLTPSNLTVTVVSILGEVTVSGGSGGPYIVYGQMKTIP